MRIVQKRQINNISLTDKSRFAVSLFQELIGENEVRKEEVPCWREELEMGVRTPLVEQWSAQANSEPRIRIFLGSIENQGREHGHYVLEFEAEGEKVIAEHRQFGNIHDMSNGCTSVEFEKGLERMRYYGRTPRDICQAAYRIAGSALEFLSSYIA